MNNRLKSTTEIQTVRNAKGEIASTKTTERIFVYELSDFLKTAVLFVSFFILATGMILLSSQ